MRPVNDEDVLRDLDREMAGYGNGAKLADRIGVKPAHLREMKSGARLITMKVATWLGYELRWVRKVVSDE